MTKHDDFMVYVDAVIRHWKTQPGEFPTIRELLVRADVMGCLMIADGLTDYLAMNFIRSIPSFQSAKEIETLAAEGRAIAFERIFPDNGVRH